MNGRVNFKTALTETVRLDISVFVTVEPFKDDAQTALFKDPVRTAQ